MITIEYTKHGVAVNEFDIESWLNKLKLDSHKQDVILRRVSTSLPVFAVQTMVAEGIFKAEEVRFMFKNKFVVINDYGKIENWPAGFADICGTYSIRTLSAAMEKRRSEKITS